MPRGGNRRGAGRPKKTPPVIPFPGGSLTLPPPGPEPPAAGAPPTDAERAQLLEPPADLPGVIGSIAIAGLGSIQSPADFWRQWAPHALDLGTLTPARAAGFRELCEVASFKEECAARIRKHGMSGKEGAERMRSYDRLSKRVEAGLDRFKLTADGKPAVDPAQKPGAGNPWAAIG